MKTYNLISDSELVDELATCFRNRNIDQKFLYQWEWAESYYKLIDSDKLYKSKNSLSLEDDMLIFWEENCFNTDNIAMISLGCWKSIVEKYIFLNTHKRNKIDYFWVDSSKEMLELSIENLKDLEINKKFICSDFSTKEFRDELEQLTNNYEKRIFTFFSNTFWNINHTNIIDILLEILNKGEQIWMDVRLRENNSAVNNMKIFNIHEEASKNESTIKFFSNIFIVNNIPYENWFISRSMKEEEWLNALKMEFFFNFTKKTEINLRGKIIFLPNEKIKLMQIYYYDPEKLIEFFEQHHFKLVNKQIKWLRGQFLFEKL